MNENSTNKNNPESVQTLTDKVQKLIRKNAGSDGITFEKGDIEQYEIKKKNKTAAWLATGFFCVLALVIVYEGFILYCYYQDTNAIQVIDNNMEVLKYKNEMRKAAIVEIRYAVKDLFMILGSIGTGIFAYYFASDIRR